MGFSHGLSIPGAKAFSHLVYRVEHRFIQRRVLRSQTSRSSRWGRRPQRLERFFLPALYAGL